MDDATPRATSSDIALHCDGPVLRITLNRSAKLNAFTPDMVALFNAALDRAEQDDAVHVLVVTGAGRAFCAGADLKMIRELGPGLTEAEVARMTGAFVGSVGALFDRVESFSKPVIAAVNGTAVAAGLELVLCCDVVIAAADALIGDGHANFGLLPGGGSSVRLPRRVGALLAKFLMFTGDSMPAADLAGSGLITLVAPKDQLAEIVDRVADKLAEKSPLVLRRMKALVDDGLTMPAAVALRQEREMNRIHAQSYDRNEGLTAFAMKRKPRFVGA